MLCFPKIMKNPDSFEEDKGVKLLAKAFDIAKKKFYPQYMDTTDYDKSIAEAFGFGAGLGASWLLKGGYGLIEHFNPSFSNIVNYDQSVVALFVFTGLLYTYNKVCRKDKFEEYRKEHKVHKAGTNKVIEGALTAALYEYFT